VKAIYSDDTNEPAWYEAVIDSEDKEAEDKYWVTFPEYGNTEYVDLGDMELLHPPAAASSSSNGGGGRDRDRERETESDRRKKRDDSRSRSRDRSDRGGGGGRRDKDRSSRSRSRDRPDTENLLEKVLKSEREASAAIGRNYGHRPASYKGDEYLFPSLLRLLLLLLYNHHPSALLYLSAWSQPKLSLLCRVPLFEGGSLHRAQEVSFARCGSTRSHSPIAPPLSLPQSHLRYLLRLLCDGDSGGQERRVLGRAAKQTEDAQGALWRCLLRRETELVEMRLQPLPHEHASCIGGWCIHIII
jgi:hypothetical protein